MIVHGGRCRHAVSYGYHPKATSTAGVRRASRASALGSKPPRPEPIALSGPKAETDDTADQHQQPVPPLAVDVPTRQWLTVVLLSALVALICSVDRAAMSVAILPMAEEYHWSDSTKGAISGAFFLGYTLTNVLGGYLATTWSAKKVLGWGVVIWSAFTMATPAAAVSMPALLTARFVMGGGEGVTFPTVQTLVKGWVPKASRSRSLAFVYSGAQMGTIVALLTSPLIISTLSWHYVFYLYGALGLVWIFPWNILVGEQPPLLGQSGPAGPAAHTAQNSNGKMGHQLAKQGGELDKTMRLQDLPWGAFVRNKPLAAIFMAHAMFGVGHYFSIAWLPTYFYQVFGVDVAHSASLAVLPWAATVAASNASGWLADALVNSGAVSTTNARKIMQAIGSLGPAACLIYLALGLESGGINDAMLVMTATLALGGFQSAGFASNHQDISTRYAAVLFGVTNASSSLTGSLSVFATGLVLDYSGSWQLVFGCVAACYILGAIFYIAWASAEQQFD